MITIPFLEKQTELNQFIFWAVTVIVLCLIALIGAKGSKRTGYETFCMYWFLLNGKTSNIHNQAL